ncbi:hypothetical protein EG328_010755 [Venturia inaequalis]|uniref:Uncharacterized protein n=1 Tax=Venturia inaequalis TaxID=5025 RepID=A0A8H3V922_VENIN|nr:hypothetical protein EG328_010755 [Venturia inaequalis]
MSQISFRSLADLRIPGRPDRPLTLDGKPLSVIEESTRDNNSDALDLTAAIGVATVLHDWCLEALFALLDIDNWFSFTWILTLNQGAENEGKIEIGRIRNQITMGTLGKDEHWEVMMTFDISPLEDNPSGGLWVPNIKETMLGNRNVEDKAEVEKMGISFVKDLLANRRWLTGKNMRHEFFVESPNIGVDPWEDGMRMNPHWLYETLDLAKCTTCKSTAESGKSLNRCGTVYQVVKYHRDEEHPHAITKKYDSKKPPLTEEQQEERGAVCMDNLNTYAGIYRPCFIWEPETPKEIEHHRGLLEAEALRVEKFIQEQIEQALTEGTDIFNELKAVNEKIRQANAEAKLANPRAGRKQEKTTEKVFKEEVFKRTSKKGGMDFITYANICENLLFPYVDAIQKQYPSREVWITQDNAGLHHKAIRYLHSQGKGKEYRFAAIAAKSLDLYNIKECIGGFRRLLGIKNDHNHITSATKAVREVTAERVIELWELEAIDDIIEKFASYQCWAAKAMTCIEYNGRNDFHG